MLPRASLGPADGPGFWWAMRAVTISQETTPAPPRRAGNHAGVQETTPFASAQPLLIQEGSPGKSSPPR